MKIISIGRNPDNNIVIPDNMISRRHAVIRIYPLGKYEIISSGSNGTKVNGNQIVPNQPYPIKRGDSVTFANVSNLDWKQVPNPLRPYQWSGLGIVIIAVIICFILFIPPLFSGWSTSGSGNPSGGGEDAETSSTLPTDSLKNEKPKESKPEIKELPDFKFKPIEKKTNKKKNEDVKEEDSKEQPVQPTPEQTKDKISPRY